MLLNRVSIRTWAAALLDQAERKQSILDAISRPAEKTKPWYDYRKIFLTDKRAREGVAFAQQNAETLAKVSDQTGVPASVITAIIGVETFYGRITGSYRVIDALATLAFDYPKRSPFFTRELQNFLVLAYESGKDPLALKGSYAGAMGYGQFMPSSYRAYAVDYDGDGVADIWTNADDAIASVANYFLRHGWQPGAPVIVPANYDGDSSEIFAGGLKPEKTVGELAEEGFAPRSATDISLVATPLRLEGSEGYEYWLCLENFYVITRYNHSAMYALSVWQLSQEIESLAAGA
jgi:membrane-bound lytic murein transglycosylase B